MTIESRISVFTSKITTFLLRWANFGLKLCSRRKWHIWTIMRACHVNWISLIFLIWNFSLRNKVQAHNHCTMFHWDMGGPEVGGCLRRSLSGWKYFKKNVCGRDLRSSQNSEQSVWICNSKTFDKFFKVWREELQRFQFPASPVPLQSFHWFQGRARLASTLWGMDPGEKWTRQEKKKGWTREKESSVDKF